MSGIWAVHRTELYSNEDGSVPATFQMIYFIGWKPDPSQPKALERGSGNVSLKDIYRLDEIVQELGNNFLLNDLVLENTIKKN